MKKSLPSLKIHKSNYGPQGYDSYSQEDNARRKVGRTNESVDVGPNSEVRFAGPTRSQAAANQAKLDRQKSKKNPVRIFSQEERKAMANDRGLLAASEGMAKALSPEEIQAHGYSFKLHEGNKGYYVLKVLHNKQKVGHIAYRKRPIENSVSKDFGYHKVEQADIDPSHQGKGLYQHMLTAARDHVKSLGSKGLMSSGYQRSKQATHAWDKVPAHTSTTKEDGSDYYLAASEMEKGARGDWESEGYTVKPHFQGDDWLEIRAVGPNGKHVGYTRLDKINDKTYAPTETQIHPDHQRKGLATAMYKLAESHLKTKLDPSLFQSTESEKLWTQPNRPFGKSEDQGIKNINWKAPTIDQAKSHLKSEEEHEAATIAHTGRVVSFSPEQISKIQRGEGETPPKDWLLNPASAPKDVKGHEFRYYHGHHKLGGLIDRMKTGQDVEMPIIGKYGNNHVALGGRHRIAYAHSLGLPLKAIVIDNPPEPGSSIKKTLQKSQPKSQVKINPEHGKVIASAYENMKHDPNHPEVKAAYGALIHETKQQYQGLLNSGMKISKMKPNQPNPYPTSKHMHSDVDKGHMWYYPTEQGYGDGNQASDHPMLQPTEFKDSEGKPMLANDLFRVVHDKVHHTLRNGFGPRGEHESFLEHKKTYSPLAQKALATETMGQNNTVNFGTHGEHNRANPSQTRFADQKAGLLPDHIINGKWHE